MFGYITVNKPELKIKEFEVYKSFYCGFCESLRRKYGRLGQITLSYDLTFVIMLFTGLYEHDTTHTRRRCIAHPFCKHNKQENEFSEYAADMNVLLTYYKCMDDWLDEKKYGKKILASMLKGKVRSVEEKYPEKSEEIKRLLDEIHIAEEENSSELDKAAGLFGQIMATIFVCRHDEWEDELREMGFYLGKFIYLMDAYEDIEKDIKDRNYNPLISIYKDSDFEENAYNILTMMMAECCKVFERLPVIDNVEILRNILYAGVWTRYELVKSKRKEANNV